MTTTRETADHAELAAIISDDEIARVHGHANFGSITPREVVNDGVRKYAVGYHSGHTQLCILMEHGLITKPRPGRYDANLTKKGKKYARVLYRREAALLSEIAALRGELAKTERDYSELRDSFDAVSNKLCVERAHGSRQSVRATQAERQRDELRKATETAANLFKLCTDPAMFENASTLNVYAQMTEWLVRNRPLIANQGADQ